MKVLILGGAGYIGRVVVERFAYEDHDVRVYDMFSFSRVADLPAVAQTTVGDTRTLTAGDFADVDVVLDLAAISNDPSGALNLELTREVNAEARIRAATLAKQMGVQRYLLFSSCSVYGANDGIADETTPRNPLTEYAASNARAEDGVLALADADFCVSAFRLATVFGVSPSMRFDLVVNTMTLRVFESGRILVTGGGEQYRPLVHVADIAKAASMLVQTPTAKVNGEIFNIGHVNLQMHEVARAVVRGVNRPVEIQVDRSDPDLRNYRITAAKARETFGFIAERTVESGVSAILEALEQGTLSWTPLSIRLNGYREFVLVNQYPTLIPDLECAAKAG